MMDKNSTAVTPQGWVDAHAHLQDPRVNAFRDEWITECSRAGIQKHLLGGVDPEDWRLQHRITAQYPGKMRASFGLHPWWVAAHSDEECESALVILDEMLKAFARDPRDDFRPWAIGETGLDFHERFSVETHARQTRFFREHLTRARALNLPLVLHIVNAHEPALRVLEEMRGALAASFSGIIHSFSGGLDLALRYRRLGFLLSISAAVITRASGKAFDSLRSAVLNLGSEDFVVETDSPDQPPAGRKGQMNPPLALLEVARRIADIRGVSEETILSSSTENLRREFGV